MIVWTLKTTITTTIVRAVAAKSARISVASCRMQRRSRSPSLCRCREKNRDHDEGKYGPVERQGQSSWTRILAAIAAKSARPTARHRRPQSRENSPSILLPSSVSWLNTGSVTAGPDILYSLSSSACCHITNVWRLVLLVQQSVSQLTISPLFLSVLNAMAVEDYRNNHWPNLEKAIDRLLIQNTTDHISVSYAQIYRWDRTHSRAVPCKSLVIFVDLTCWVFSFVFPHLVMSTSVFVSSTLSCSTMTWH